MKKIAVIVMSAALAFSVAACSVARADSDVTDAGSASSFEQQTQTQPTAVESDEPEIEIPAFEPVELDFDNPLADVEIASVKLRVTEVGEKKLDESDAQTIIGIIQNDDRVYVERYSFWPSKLTDGGRGCITSPWFVVTLESGEELQALALRNAARTNLYLNDCCYELTDDECDTFSTICDEYRPQVIDAADEFAMPYAELTVDQLDKVVRLDYDEFTYEDENTELTDEQVEMLVNTLRKLEMEPATVEFGHEMLYGGGGQIFSYFELWFKDGRHYEVGEYSSHMVYDENDQFVESYPVVYIDGVIFRCNEEYDHDMYWDYKEMDPDYEPSDSYTNARTFPDYRFEDMGADEIEYMGVYMDGEGQWVWRDVPMSLVDEAVAALAKLRLSDDARNDEMAEEMTVEERQRANQLSIRLSNNDVLQLGVDGDYVFFNFHFYEEDSEAIDALQDFIDLAHNEAGF